jgi:hypothetical protein
MPVQQASNTYHLPEERGKLAILAVLFYILLDTPKGGPDEQSFWADGLGRMPADNPRDGIV